MQLFSPTLSSPSLYLHRGQGQGGGWQWVGGCVHKLQGGRQRNSLGLLPAPLLPVLLLPVRLPACPPICSRPLPSHQCSPLVDALFIAGGHHAAGKNRNGAERERGQGVGGKTKLQAVWQHDKTGSALFPVLQPPHSIQRAHPRPAAPCTHPLPANATAPHSRIEQGHPIVHLLLCHLNGGRRVLLLPPLLLRHGCCWLRPRAAGAATEAVACHLLLLLAGLGIGRYGCSETGLQQQSGGTWRASCKTWQALPACLAPTSTSGAQAAARRRQCRRAPASFQQRSPARAVAVQRHAAAITGSGQPSRAGEALFGLHVALT
jgi:hypothetical protein